MSRTKNWGIAAAVGVAVVASAAALIRSGWRVETGSASSDRAATEATAPAGPVETTRGGFLFAKASSRGGRGTFIVMFEEAPLATYQGGVAGIPAPGRNLLAKGGRPRLDPSSTSSRAYVAYLQKRQSDLKNRMSSMAGRTLQTRMAMQHAVNAVVVDLSREEADAIRGLAGVSLVEEYEEFETATDRGPQLIGAEPVWNGTNVGAGGQQYRGEGMVVAILDSGINYGSPSFAATGPIDGYVHTNPLGAGTFLGTCASGGVNAGNCNAKLIGGFDFVCASPGNQCGVENVREEPGFGDTDGHGSHVASTAAGNVRNADFAGALRRISGVAPHANIIAYDICYHDTTENTGRCPNVSALAAIDQLVSTGVVDAVNYSIGGGADPWTGSVSLAFLNAVEAGIYVSAAGGNSGPGADTVSHLQPWVATVGAVQHGRGGYATLLNVTGPAPVPANLTGITAAEGTGGTPHSGPIAGTTLLKLSPGIDTVDDGCAGYPRGTFTDAIAVIRRGTCSFSTKVGGATVAGAIAVVIVNNVPGTLTPSVPSTSIPAFAVTQSDGNALRDFAATRPTTTASIGFPASPLANTPDVVASFSSRGPSGVFNILKPDVSAPGVSILATDAGTTINGFESLVGLKSGTSMASPHHAGSAALLRQARPTWSVPEVRSAFALTAFDQVLATNETSPATPFDTGSGRIRVDRAINAGLVMHETGANYRAANPEIGGNPANLNQPNLMNGQCGASCTFTRTFRNPQASASTWNLQLSGVNGTVPASITVPAGGSLAITVTLRPTNTPGTWAFGRLTLTPVGSSNTPLQLPIAVIGASKIPRNDINGNGTSDLLWANGSNLSWWETNASGAVVATGGQATPSNYIAIATGDFDGNGASDVLWRAGANIRMWLKNPTGGYTDSVVNTYPVGWRLVGAGDVNNDGRSDLFWQLGTTVSVWLMNGSGVANYTNASIALGNAGTMPLAVADFSCDGRADVLWRNTNNELVTWVAQSSGSSAASTAFAQQTIATYPSGWVTRGAGDFNGDGCQDITWFNSSALSYWLMSANSSGVISIIGTGGRALPGAANLIAIVDINGNGLADAAIREPNGVMSALMDFGTGTTQQSLFTYPAGWLAIDGQSPYIWRRSVSGDLNADQRSDLGWTNGSTYSFWTMFGSVLQTVGGQNFATPRTVLGTGDFDGDLLQDVLFRTNAGELMRWRRTPTQFVEEMISGYPTGWTVAGIADIDGDGRDDILWQNGSNFSYWAMESNTVRLVGGQVLPSAYTPLAASDLDGDGRSDMLWRASDNQMHVSKSIGLAFNNTPIGAYPTGWAFLGAGDVDGDLAYDLMWHNGSGVFTHWKMLGFSPSPQPGQAMAITGTVVATGDYDGNGRTDLVWRTASDQLILAIPDGTATQAASTYAITGYPVGWTAVR